MTILAPQPHVRESLILAVPDFDGACSISNFKSLGAAADGKLVICLLLKTAVAITASQKASINCFAHLQAIRRVGPGRFAILTSYANLLFMILLAIFGQNLWGLIVLFALSYWGSSFSQVVSGVSNVHVGESSSV